MLGKKAFKRVVSSALALAMTLSLGAFSVSADTAVKVSYDAESESITANLTTDRKEKTATITIEKDGKFWVIDEFARSSKESFTTTCKLPTDCPSGSYLVSVTIGGEVAIGEIAHINKTMAAKAIERINGATEDTFASVLENTHLVLAIDLTKFNRYSEKLTEIYYKYKAEGDLTIAEFSKYYDKCYTLCTFADLTDEECEKSLLENAGLLEFDYEEFDKKTEPEKEELIDRFQKGEYMEATLKEQYTVWSCLAEINALTDGGVVTYEEALFDKYASLLELDTELYEESEDQQEVIRLMMENKYNTIDEIRKAYQSAIDEVIENEDKKSSSGSSGGGGGGSSKGGTVGGISWTPVKEEVKAETETEKTEDFRDVAKTHWCSEPIRYMLSKGIVSGMGNNEFYPDKNVTRAEFSKMLVNALFANEKAEKTAEFGDVDEDNWCYEFVNKAYSLGIVSGSDGNFNPNSAISRQDMAVMIYRAQQKLGYISKEGKTFTDEEKIADYAKDAVSSLAGMGILNGFSDGSFAPTDILTRAQAVKALYEAMNILLK